MNLKLNGREADKPRCSNGNFIVMAARLYGGISILAWLDLAGGCGIQSETCHFQSGPDQSPVRSNTIPDFRDITVDFVTIYLWALYCPDSRTWLAQANSLILPGACQDSEMSKNEVVGKSWTWTSV